MKLIKPAEISSKIMTLIDEADESLLIVSPYNDLEKWDKIIKHFERAMQRGITMSYYARKGVIHKGLNLLKIKPILIKDLHAKIYMNEKYAIVASMNLVRYSDVQSLDIGYMVTEDSELADLRDYVKRYIVSTNSMPNTKEINSDSNVCIPDYIKCEVIFAEFYTRFFNKNIFDKSMSFHKEYYPNSTFIQCCGFSKFRRNVGAWIWFNEQGFVSKIHYYEHGKINSTSFIKFDMKINLYDIVFSLINIIGALYRKSVAQLYFNEPIHHYIKEDKSKLYNYLENYFLYKFESYDHNNLSEIAKELKLFLKNSTK